MIESYNQDNKDALFRSGCNEPFKQQTWELLGYIVTAREHAVDQMKLDKRKQNELIENSKNKKNKITDEVMTHRAGNSRPPSIADLISGSANNVASGSISDASRSNTPLVLVTRGNDSFHSVTGVDMSRSSSTTLANDNEALVVEGAASTLENVVELASRRRRSSTNDDPTEPLLVSTNIYSCVIIHQELKL